MRNSLSLTASTHKTLKEHLYPGDNLEMAAIMLCHLGKVSDGFKLMVKEVILIPADRYKEQTSSYLSWPFAEYMNPDKISQIDKKGLSVFYSSLPPRWL